MKIQLKISFGLFRVKMKIKFEYKNRIDFFGKIKIVCKNNNIGESLEIGTCIAKKGSESSRLVFGG